MRTDAAMTTDPDRWGTIERLYLAALALPVGRRAAYLAEACAGDDVLRREIESLLAQDASAGGVLDGGAVALAAALTSDAGASSLTGRRIGTYQIVAQLGSGGMGQVYRARDTRLGRDVAIKMLPPAFMAHPDRLARFEREARVLASLNHPNIATIYGLEDGPAEAGPNARAIVMELVEGETLADRIRRGLQMGEALAIGRQIADALSAAHERGIVHRDLKPANVVITLAGVAKVLDFGLAKVDVPAGGPAALTQSPTITSGATEDGALLGTAAYMSPEQVRGHVVDKRTDIWALGCVVFEMLAGRSPFLRGTMADTLAAVLERDPDWEALPPPTPQPIVRLLRRCLDKNPARRLHDIGDARLELDDAHQPMPTTRGKSWVPAAVAVILFAAAGAYWFARAEPPADSIAVPPFVNVSGNEEAEYLGDGIAESLINSLSQVSSLAVTSRNAAFRYKGHALDAQAAGKALNVQAVLAGTVAQRGEDLSISTELIDVRSNRHLWGERYNRKVRDILSVQDDIATEISNRLRLRLTGEQKQRLVKQYTQNTEAYTLYLKGRFYWNKKTPDGFYKGIDYFQQAIAVDPNYAPAYAALAALYNNIGNYNFALIAPNEAWAKAKAAAAKALEIDDTLAAAHTAAALVAYQWEWDWPVTEREFKRAIELDPASASTFEPAPASTYHWYAHYLMSVGRTEESLRAGRRAFELDPLAAGVSEHQGWYPLFTRHYDDAIEPLQKTIEINPTSVAMWYLGLAYEQQRSYPAAIAQFEKCIRLTDGRPSMVALLGHTYAAAGRTAEALGILRQLEATSSHAYVPPYPIALIYAALGQRDEAFAWLDKAYAGRDSWLDYLAVDPRLDVLRSDRRFSDLLRRMKLG